MHKYNRFSEIMWLILTILSVAMVVYYFIDEGKFDKSKWYLVIPLLAFAMYIARRSIRIRMEKSAMESGDGKKSKK